MRYLITNGIIQNAYSQLKADILIENDKIIAIGNSLNTENVHIIDANNMYVLPGGIDIHTHMSLPIGDIKSSDTFTSGTTGAICGGITTIIDFVTPNKNESLLNAIYKRRQEADNNVYTDYKLHVTITEYNEQIIKEIPKIIELGYYSFKLYMTYDISLDDYALFNTIKTINKYGGISLIHAENKNMILENIKYFINNNCREPKYHALSRPDYVEAEAIGRVCEWALIHKASIYIVHLSSAKGLEKIRYYRKLGLKIYVETCPQYLLLAENMYLGSNFEGAKYVISPPLRTENDINELWQAIFNDEINVISSDHCPFDFELKKRGLNNFSLIPNGIAGVETIIPLIYSYGVKTNKIDLAKMVEIISYNPAKIFKRKNKGAIEVNKDADIIILNTNIIDKININNLHTNVDYSPYENININAKICFSMLRGKIIYQDNIFNSEKMEGKYII